MTGAIYELTQGLDFVIVVLNPCFEHKVHINLSDSE